MYRLFINLVWTKNSILIMISFVACVLTAALIAAMQFNHPMGSIAAHHPQSTNILPQGQIIYSANSEATSDQIRSDLFLRRMPSGKTRRLTTAHSSPTSGGDAQQPKFSPDGRQVVFLDSDSNVPELEREMSMGHSPDLFAFLNLWRLDVATGRVHPVTRDGRGWHMACWSPDGTRIAAVRSGHVGVLGDIPADDLFVFDTHTWQKHCIAREQGPIFSVSWAGNSRSILYQPVPDRIYEVSYRNGVKRLLAQGKHIITSYSLSPNGRYAALVQDNVLILRKSDGGPTAPIIKMVGSEADLARGPSWSRPIWSHDSHRIVVCEAVTDKQHRLIQVQVHTFDTAGRSRIVAVLPADTPQNVSILSWSRNGKWLIITSSPDLSHTELLAVSTQNGQVATLKAPTELLHGLDWHEIVAP